MTVTTRFAIEFRSGTYFRHVDDTRGSSAADALTFISRHLAETYLRRLPAWVLANGGYVVEMPALSARAPDLEALRTFAISHGEVAFAHLVTAALAGEEWAVDRIHEAQQDIVEATDCHGHDDLSGPMGSTMYCDGSCRDAVECKLEVIRATDTTRPDGAIARGIEV